MIGPLKSGIIMMGHDRSFKMCTFGIMIRSPNRFPNQFSHLSDFGVGVAPQSAPVKTGLPFNPTTISGDPGRG